MDTHEDLIWTTGNQENLTHTKRIAFGGYGEVHEVITLINGVLTVAL